MHDPNCLFCKIIAGEIPSYKIYEDDQFLAFLDISQFSEGHTIVVPKEHYEFIWDVPNSAEYIKVAQKIGNHFRSLGYLYVDTMTFGRDIPHAHWHLIPHNDEPGDFKTALEKIGDMQHDLSRRPDSAKGKVTQEKFQLK